MGIDVMEGLRFADTQETCFEGWICSHMGCNVILCSRFAKFLELLFQLENRSERPVPNWKVFYFRFVRNGTFRPRSVQIREPFCKVVDLVML